MVRYNSRIEIYKTASFNRSFESSVFDKVKEKIIQFPVYLSAGQEYTSAALSYFCKLNKINPLIFAQHRAHSTYLSFGGKPEELIDELLGRNTGCAYGMGGSASIHSKDIDMFGHDGLMGSQVPIGVGACYSSKKPTIVFMGDASAEEDYALGAIGWASTKKLPILFVVEDNNLSILTEKKIRRNWEMDSVAKAFNMKAFDIDDEPDKILEHSELFFKEPILLNVRTNRLYWHSGAGIDSEETFDRLKEQRTLIGDEAVEIDKKNQLFVEDLWKKQLEKQ